MTYTISPSPLQSVFVGGGAGFIGSHLVPRLLAEPDLRRIVVYDNFSSGTWAHLAAVAADPRVRLVVADLKDRPAIEAAMAGCDTVFHLAANPDIARAVTEPDIDFREGTCLAQNVLEAMRRTGAKEIVYTSGSGVYGEQAAVAFREDFGPCVPISTYGASKLACEALIAAYAHMFGLRGRVFRFANVVGPRQTHGVGYDFIRRLRSDPRRLRVLGDGRQSKSYIHVEDVLDAILLGRRAAPGPYEVFNVATGDYITVTEIARLAIELCGLDPAQVEIEYTGGDRGWKGDVPVVRFDCTKIRSLGWTCRRGSAEALRASMAAMLAEVGGGA